MFLNNENKVKFKIPWLTIFYDDKMAILEKKNKILFIVIIFGIQITL